MTVIALQWLWHDASNLLWAHYGVSSKIGRWCDYPRGGIPLGKVALNQFVMLGEQGHPDRERYEFDRFKYDKQLHRHRAPKSMSSELHAALGAELKAALSGLGQWEIAKTHRRSKARARLRNYFDRLRCLAHGLAAREHGEIAWDWYYPPGGAR